MRNIKTVALEHAPMEIRANEDMLNAYVEGAKMMSREILDWMDIFVINKGYNLCLNTMMAAVPFLLKYTKTSEYIAITDKDEFERWRDTIAANPEDYMWRPIEEVDE